ncbi:MAG: hypothetical protein HY905_19500 [Deltaproteobacteria bacterium]|nr:hypothetical protein [Deltaproteobacteria bacterium]
MATLLAALAVRPVPAAAGDTAYTITETLIAEWLWDNGNDQRNDDYYWDIKNRLNIGILADGIDAGFRIDTASFGYLEPAWISGDTEQERLQREADWYERYGVTQTTPGEYSHVGDYRLERGFAKVQLTPDWLLTGGDFYAHIGRGLILSLRKVDELGLDSALRGGRVDGRIADRFDVTVMGGVVNVTNVDERYNLISEDPLDIVVAGRVAADLWGGNRLALHVMDLQPHLADANQTGTVGYGGALEFLDLPYSLTFYAEADGLHRSFESGETDDGWALYANAGAKVGPVQLLLEYKEYHEFGILSEGQDATHAHWPYNRPPTADLEDQLIESEFDVRGGRLKADWEIFDWFTVFAAFAGADDFTAINHDAIHPYGGLEFRWDEGQSVARVVAGYRRAWDEVPDPDPGAPPDALIRELYRTLVHVRFDLQIHVWGPLSLQAEVLDEEWSERDIDKMLDYRRGTAALSLDWAGIGGVYGTFEWDTQFEGNPSDEREHYFGAGGIQWFAADWLTVRGRVGSLRGGRKCLAGVCRTFPPFDGMRLEVIFRL